MKIVQVASKTDWKHFHRVPHHVFKDNPFWIAPLESDINNVFDPSQNRAFQDGEAQCFIIFDGQKQAVGRIAAFIDHKRNKSLPYPIGGIGFFECVDNQEYAFALFEAARDYLSTFRVKAIDGPINFGERDKFWGLLSNCYDKDPLFQENYHPPYYFNFFEAWGFEKLEQILTRKAPIVNLPYERVKKIAERLLSRGRVRTEKFSFKHLDRYANDFSEVYNASFNVYEHFKPLSPASIREIMVQAKTIADPNLTCIAYYDDQPAGFVALFPEINQLIKPFKGKLNWMTIPQFFYRKATAKKMNVKGMGFGVHPDFQSKGIYSLLVNFLATKRNRTLYDNLYLATTRAHNHQATALYSKLSTAPERIHYTMRKSLDPAIEVVPFEFWSPEKP